MTIGPKLVYQNCSKKWLLFKKSSELISYSVSFSSSSIIRYASISTTKKASRQRRAKVKTVAEGKIIFFIYQIRLNLCRE
jgi:hypothetical protein